MFSSIQANPKLLYLSCEQKEHQRRCLDHVCIDRSCSKHWLVCSICIDTNHKGHQVMLLADLIEKLDNLRFSGGSKQSTRQALLHSLKAKKVDYMEQLASLKKAMQ